MSAYQKLKLLFSVHKSRLTSEKILKGTAKCINIFFILFSLNMLSGNFGCFLPSFNRICVFCILLGIFLVNIPFKKIYTELRIKQRNAGLSKKELLIGASLILLAFAILFLTTEIIFWLTSIPIFISGLNLMVKNVDKEHLEFSVLSAVSIGYVLFILLEKSIPQVWHFVQFVSLSFSTVVGKITGHTAIGPSASGSGILITFLLFSIFLFILSEKKKTKFVFCILGILVANIIYLLAQGFYPFNSPNDIINSQYIFFFFGLVPILIYTLQTKIVCAPGHLPQVHLNDLGGKKIVNVIKRWEVFAVLLLFLSCTILTIFPYSYGEGGHVVFSRKNMLGDWSVPGYGVYGQYAPGMFGLLPEYLNASGYTTEVIEENITKDALKDVDVFVVISINKTLTPEEHKIIWEFVAEGGSLLVLGDHTDVGGLMTPLNELLEPVGIEFRFDCAIPLKERWVSCLELANHPITTGIDYPNEIFISVGASLDITKPTAFPIVMGKYGFSDSGNYENVAHAFLGDYECTKGEQLCDVILVAGAYYGKGKVLVFGDTSPFQNSALPYSHSFVNNVFSWLTSKETSTSHYAQIGISLILLIVTILLFYKKKSKSMGVYFWAIVICVSLILSGCINHTLMRGDKIEGKLVYIDVSHGEYFATESYTDNSVDGLMLSMARNGYLPLILRDFSYEKIASGKILVLIAPTQKFSDNELEDIKKFTATGGLVILSVGYQDKEASNSLLSDFGLDIANIPLGPVPYGEKEPEEYMYQPRFVDSWPIIINDEKDTRIFYTALINEIPYHLVVLKKYGDGGFLLIGDSLFLLNKNIESIYSYWFGNILFLKNTIYELKEEGIPR